MGVYNIVFTEEEKAVLSQTLLEKLRSGENRVTHLEKQMGVSKTTINKLKKQLIDSGEITDEEIEIAAQERIKYEEENDPDTLKILEGLRAGKICEEIGEEIGMLTGTVVSRKQKLIKSGRITKEEITAAYKLRKAREKAEKKAKLAEEPEIAEITEELKSQVLELLLIGLSDQILKSEVGINAKTLAEVKKILKQEEKITDEAIVKARENRAEMLKNTTYELLMQGYNYYEISDRIPYTKPTHFPRIVKTLKDEGRITDEQIELAKVDENEERRLEVVLQGLERGLTYSETAEIDKSLNLTEQQFRDRQKKLIALGKITKEEIEKQRKLASKRKSADRKEEYEAPLDKEIKRLTKEKKSAQEIAQELGVTVSYINRRNQEMREKAQRKKRGISREDLRKCLEDAKFPEEQIQRILKKDLKTILRKGNIYKTNKILRKLMSYGISFDAIERSFNVLVDSCYEDLEDTLKVIFDEYKISKDAVEGCLTVVSRGKADEIREIFKVLNNHLIEKEVIENCLSVLVSGRADEIKGIFEVLDEHLIGKETIEGCLTVLSRGKADEMREVFKILDKHLIGKESIEKCLSVLAYGKADDIKGVFEVLDAHLIANEAIENCLSVLVRSKADEIRKVFEALDEYRIDKNAIEKSLYVLADGKADNIRAIFKVLKDSKINKNQVEKCLSMLTRGNPEEMREVIKTLKDKGLESEEIGNSLFVVATGKSDKMQEVFEVFQKCKLDSRAILKKGLKILLKDKDSIEKIILTLQNNGVRKEVIEEELSSVVNSLTPEEVEEMFNDTQVPKNKEVHYANVRRYMSLKELYGRVYSREEIESFCARKHLSVREFISEIQTYPRGKDFVDIYYEKLMTEGSLYIGGSTEIDKKYQEQHGEELIALSKRVARTFAWKNGRKDYLDLESKALEIMLIKCGNLVHNLSHIPDKLYAAMFKKTSMCLRAETIAYDTVSLTSTSAKYGYEYQRDIPVEDEISLIGSQTASLEDTVNYEKAEFNSEEIQVMKCMIRLVEDGEANDLTKKVADIIIMDEEEIYLILERIRVKMLQNKLVTVRADGGYAFTTDDDEQEL